MKTKLFKKNVTRYKNLIYSQAYYFLGNPEDAADITQEVLIKLWHHLEKVSPQSMKSWLLRVTKNLCIDHSRRKRELTASQMMKSIDGNEEFQFDGVDQNMNPEQQVLNLDLREQILYAMQKLPEKIKHVIIMREIQDLKYEDIALSMDIPLNSVKVYLNRGRKLLFKYLKPYYQQEWSHDL